MSERETTRLLKAKRLVDGTGSPPKEDAAVLIVGDRIREIGHQEEISIPQGTEIVDLGDRTIMPGIVDAHMHFFGVPSNQLHLLASEDPSYRALRAAGEARKMLHAGITAARCLGSSVSPSLRRAINEGHVPGPRIVAAGEFICSTDGTWDHIGLPVDWVESLDMLADGVEAVRQIVRRRIRQGATVIKVGLSKGVIDDKYHAWGDDPFQQVASYSLEEIRSLTAEAHRNQLKVSAHCIGDEAVRNALEGGVDTIEHGYGIGDDTRQMLVDQNALVVSTISQLYFHNRAADPFHYPDWQRALFQRHLDAMRAGFEASLKAGVRFALGTDLIGYPTHPQNMAAKEFELAVQWGMTPMEALVAGTRTSADALGLEAHIGTLEVGKLADIIGFAGDPLKDITALQRVDFVMLGGEVVRLDTEAV
jgi:imidazolonepropionase-like amidohydrolase